MSSTCEVIGWLLDEGGARMVVREENGSTSLEKAGADTLGNAAIQTGTFRRGKAIIDPITHERVGYEMEQVPSSFAHI
ncbi:MAG: hypothetical protein ABW110_12025 [Steroidobacteraceae bacterium]